MTTKRANPNYSASAVNLTYSPVSASLLAILQGKRKELDDVLVDIEMTIPRELKTKRADIENAIEQADAELRLSIAENGGYQDIESGSYALIQRKVSKSYDAGLFETRYPMFAPAVIVKAVDTTKLTGLIKGGLVTELDLLKNGILQEKESFVFIIK